MTCAEAMEDATLSDCGCATAGSGIDSRHLMQNNLVNDRGDRFEVLLRRHTGMDNCAILAAYLYLSSGNLYVLTRFLLEQLLAFVPVLCEEFGDGPRQNSRKGQRAD
jgi:hypothetical protein